MLITFCPNCATHRLGNVADITRIERTPTGLVAIAPCPDGHLASTELEAPAHRHQMALAC